MKDNLFPFLAKNYELSILSHCYDIHIYILLLYAPVTEPTKKNPTCFRERKNEERKEGGMVLIHNLDSLCSLYVDQVSRCLSLFLCLIGNDPW